MPELFAAVSRTRNRSSRFAAANNDAVSAAVSQAVQPGLTDLKATATDDYALGEERFLKMLRHGAGRRHNARRAQRQAGARRPAKRNLDALERGLRRAMPPGASARDCVQRVQNRRPRRRCAVAGATRQLS